MNNLWKTLTKPLVNAVQRSLEFLSEVHPALLGNALIPPQFTSETTSMIPAPTVAEPEVVPATTRCDGCRWWLHLREEIGVCHLTVSIGGKTIFSDSRAHAVDVDGSQTVQLETSAEFGCSQWVKIPTCPS